MNFQNNNSLSVRIYFLHKRSPSHSDIAVSHPLNIPVRLILFRNHIFQHYHRSFVPPHRVRGHQFAEQTAGGLIQLKREMSRPALAARETLKTCRIKRRENLSYNYSAFPRKLSATRGILCPLSASTCAGTNAKLSLRNRYRLI